MKRYFRALAATALFLAAIGLTAPALTWAQSAVTLWIGGKAVSASNALPTTVPTNSYANIATNSSTQVKSGAGVLYQLIINGPGTSETTTLYDNTACSGATLGTVVAGLAGDVHDFNVAFGTGLCVKTAGSAAGNWTVYYR